MSLTFNLLKWSLNWEDLKGLDVMIVKLSRSTNFLFHFTTFRFVELQFKIVQSEQLLKEEKYIH